MKIVAIVFAVLIAMLVITYLFLPAILTNQINKQLGAMEGYDGKIDGVDIAILDGGYAIEGFELNSIVNEDTIPFIIIPRTALALEYRPLLKGKVVGSLKIEEPVIRLISEEAEEPEEALDIPKMLEDLLPIQINKFEIVNGTIDMYDMVSDPPMDIYLHELYVTAVNLTNVEEENEPLPADMQMKAITIGGGVLNMHVKLNPLKTIPDIDLDMSMEDMDMTALNDLFNEHASFTVEKGTFSVFSEIVVKDRQLSGYIRPIAENLDIYDGPDENQSFWRNAWEGALDAVTNVFKNHPKDKFATEMPIEGTIDEADPDIWATIGGIFYNTFIEAMEKGITDEKSFENLNPEK